VLVPVLRSDSEAEGIEQNDAISHIAVVRQHLPSPGSRADRATIDLLPSAIDPDQVSARPARDAIGPMVKRSVRIGSRASVGRLIHPERGRQAYSEK
jgi:hypothetical protein